jgi:two-component system response regulator FlrC
VDDNRDGNIARRCVLEELGYQVVLAGCGGEALKVLGQQPVDLVVTDYKMNPVNGLELIAKLREAHFQLPVILLTGFADTLGLTPHNTGADIVVQKNASELSTLLRNIRRLLARPKKPASPHTGPGAKREHTDGS